MPINTIEATPESLAEAVAALPAADRVRFYAALQNFATARNAPPVEETEEDYRLTDADKEALKRAAADIDAGRVYPASEVEGRIRERFGWTAKTP